MLAKRHTLANALRVAAEQYDADAIQSKSPDGQPNPGRESLARAFQAQAADARRLAAEIEQAGTIELED